MDKKVRTHGREGKCVRRAGGETEGESPLEKSSNMWEDSSEVDIKQLGWKRED